MEHLTKQQIILLTLFVTFVSSIATGIVVISLLGQSDVGVTQTINHVIERTVEKAVSTPQPATIIKTIKEENKDFVADAVAKVQKSIVKIKTKSNNKNTPTSIGLLISKEGLVIADKSIVSSSKDLIAVLPDGKEFSLEPLISQKDNNIVFLQIIVDDVMKSTISFNPITFADSIKLGQEIINLAGDADIVLKGIVEKVNKEVNNITISIMPARSNVGSILFDMNGNVIGIKTSSLLNEISNDFYPIGQIKSTII